MASKLWVLKLLRSMIFLLKNRVTYLLKIDSIKDICHNYLVGHYKRERASLSKVHQELYMC